jgi:predicted MPP superfamily phosphohydrolase
VKKRLSRRKLLLALLGGLGAIGGGGAYSFLESRWLRLTTSRIRLPRLPTAFSGLKVAFLSDIHHSYTVPISLVRRAVELVRSQRPDVVLLGGDYVARSRKHIAPCLEALGTLTAPLGVYAVLGNHDHWADPELTRTCLKRHGIADLTNRGVWLRRDADRLRLGGVGDLWEDMQDLEAALGDLGEEEGALLLSHNPDYAEELDSDRVDVIFSGHTHGGQVVLPLVGAPFLPSRYGMKYAGGLIQGPRCVVYVTRGVGTVGPPVRFGCRPEVSLLELAPSSG